MKTSTLTEAQAQAIAARLATQSYIPVGLGDEHAACSVAAINLALTGQLTDEIPACMSKVIGRWVIRTQDRMPAGMRNSTEWRALLPLAAGTGRDPALETRRSALIVQHMWEVALPMVQPRADARGYGVEWREMCAQRTAESARKARKAAADAVAAYAAADAADADAAYAAADAYAYAAYAAYAYAAAADAAAADAADADAYADAAVAAAVAADAAADAADAAAYAAAYAAAVAADAAAYVAAAVAAVWQKLDPIGLLQQLIDLE